MRTILVPRTQSDSLIGQLKSLYETLKNTENNENLIFDLSQLSFACPFLILSLCSYLKTTKSAVTNETNVIKSYLNTVNFPNGIDSVSAFQQKMQKNKNYVPISILARESAVEREHLEGLFANMVYKSIGISDIDGVKNAIYYPISELITNIFEHSKESKGFVFGQFYPAKGYLDICIIDRGRGLAKTYKQEKNLDLSDGDAITEVMKGNSTKPDKDRGYGVRTSKRVVCEALGGEFTIISGSSALLTFRDRGDKLLSLPNFHWQGVIIAYRIPKPNRPVNISVYLE